MTWEELEEELDNLLPPGYKIEKDNNGQLVIFTRLCEQDDGELVEMEEDEELSDDDSEEDLDFLD